jgi:hypothetical protein
MAKRFPTGLLGNPAAATVDSTLSMDFKPGEEFPEVMLDLGDHARSRSTTIR